MKKFNIALLALLFAFLMFGGMWLAKKAVNGRTLKPVPQAATASASLTKPSQETKSERSKNKANDTIAAAPVAADTSSPPIPSNAEAPTPGAAVLMPLSYTEQTAKDNSPLLVARWNGYTYIVIPAPDGITWPQAYDAARKINGCLAVIHSEELNRLIFQLIDDPKYWRNNSDDSASIGPWFNGYGRFDSLRAVVPSQGPNLQLFNGGFWRSRSEQDETKDNPPTMLTYFNWIEGNMETPGTGKLSAIYFYADKSDTRRPTWNKQPIDALAYAYVVEYPSVDHPTIPNSQSYAPPPPRLPVELISWGRPIQIIESDPFSKPVAEAIGRLANKTYQLFAAPEGITWYDASVAAMQCGGHLARIDSEAENAFVFALANRSEAWRTVSDYGANLGPWLGGWRQGSVAGFGAPASRPFEWFYATNDDQSRAVLNWKVGPKITYLPWETGQPTRESSPAMQQGRRALCLLYLANGTSRKPTWGAIPWDAHAYSFVVEWDENADPALVPVAPTQPITPTAEPSPDSTPPPATPAQPAARGQPRGRGTATR